MVYLKELFKNDDWKREKHVPVIETPLEVKRGEIFNITVNVGKEVSHPNTVEHHIRWIEVYFLPEGKNIPYQVGRFEFSAHGESSEGVEGGVYTYPHVMCNLKVDKAGVILASSYCNIHGLWENSQEIKIED